MLTKTIYVHPSLITIPDLPLIVRLLSAPPQTEPNVFEAEEQFADCVSSRAYITWNLDINELSENATVTIQVSSTTYDILVTILGQSCVDDHGVGESETLVFTPSSPGSFQIVIETNGIPSATESYELTVTSLNEFTIGLGSTSCSASTPYC